MFIEFDFKNLQPNIIRQKHDLLKIEKAFLE